MVLDLLYLVLYASRFCNNIAVNKDLIQNSQAVKKSVALKKAMVKNDLTAKK